MYFPIKQQSSVLHLSSFALKIGTPLCSQYMAWREVGVVGALWVMGVASGGATALLAMISHACHILTPPTPFPRQSSLLYNTLQI